MVFAGTPPTSVLGGTSLLTTDPAATTKLSPIEIPGKNAAQSPDPDIVPDRDRLRFGGDLARQRVIVSIHNRREFADSQWSPIVMLFVATMEEPLRTT